MHRVPLAWVVEAVLVKASDHFVSHHICFSLAYEGADTGELVRQYQIAISSLDSALQAQKQQQNRKRNQITDQQTQAMPLCNEHKEKGVCCARKTVRSQVFHHVHTGFAGTSSTCVTSGAAVMISVARYEDCHWIVVMYKQQLHIL